jgi:NADPH-dependent glutamate synthase beta subunit-like oxidoreductase
LQKKFENSVSAQSRTQVKNCFESRYEKPIKSLNEQNIELSSNDSNKKTQSLGVRNKTNITTTIEIVEDWSQDMSQGFNTNQELIQQHLNPNNERKGINNKMIEIINEDLKLDFDLILIYVMSNYYSYFKAFGGSLVWEMIANEINSFGFEDLTPIMCEIRFKVLSQKYFNCLKASTNCQNACHVFHLFPEFNSLFITFPSLYFF